MPRRKDESLGEAPHSPDKPLPLNRLGALNGWRGPDNECGKEVLSGRLSNYSPQPSEAVPGWPKNEHLHSFYSAARDGDCLPGDSNPRHRFWNWPHGKGFSAVLGLSLHPFVGRLAVALAAAAVGLLVHYLI